MAEIKTFRELHVWQVAMELVIDRYELVGSLLPRISGAPPRTSSAEQGAAP